MPRESERQLPAHVLAAIARSGGAALLDLPALAPGRAPPDDALAGLPDSVRRAIEAGQVQSVESPKRKRNPRATPKVDEHGMNATEARFASDCELEKRAGTIKEWKFEPFSLRLAPRTFYRPDFFLVRPRERGEVVEIKGHWEDDARAKVKVAAALFPFWRFVALSVRKRGEAGPFWVREEFPSA